MEVSTYIENHKVNGKDGQLTSKFYQDCLAAVGGAREEAAMVLEESGRVLFCNEEGASVFKSTPGKLEGRHLSEFVLNTRLNACTPGSNVAYAAFAGKRNQWLEYSVLNASGQSFPVELLLDVLVVNLRYLILLWVRTPAKQATFQERAAARQLPVSMTSTCGAAVAA